MSWSPDGELKIHDLNYTMPPSVIVKSVKIALGIVLQSIGSLKLVIHCFFVSFRKPLLLSYKCEIRLTDSLDFTKDCLRLLQMDDFMRKFGYMI